MKKNINIKLLEKWINRRVGRLVVVAIGEPDINGNGRVVCRCDCGSEKTIRPRNLQLGFTKSCGCLQRERASQNKGAFTHGLSKTPEYRSWTHMKDRCLNPNGQGWAHYGGRGITICPRWIMSFEDFLADLGPRPSLKHSLGRLDHDKNYEPGNVAWQTQQEQGARRGAPRPKKPKSNKPGPGEWVWRDKKRPT